jgi:hypothetical protein
MGSHPLNLAVRFLLELVGLAALGYWGWTQHVGLGRWLWAIGLPLVAAILWGTLAVPNDPARSGQAPVPIPGALRLLLELTLFAAATIALVAAGQVDAGILLAVLAVLHYALSYDRILWLLRN